MAITKKINPVEPEVVNDAVRLPKTDFISLYSELGYSASNAGEVWFNIRISKRGHELAKKLQIATPIDEGLKVDKNMKKKTSEEPAVVPTEVDTELVLGDIVKFNKGTETISGTIVRIFVGTDSKEYVKLKFENGKTCLKRLNAVEKA
jgi:hypothetical protein